MDIRNFFYRKPSPKDLEEAGCSGKPESSRSSPKPTKASENQIQGSSKEPEPDHLGNLEYVSQLSQSSTDTGLKITQPTIDNDKCDLGKIDTGPFQPYLDVYPRTQFGKQNRSFSKTYYKEYAWVEYSLKKDAVYCFACRIFGIGDLVSKESSTFTRQGLNNWQKISKSQSQSQKKALLPNK